MGYYCEEYFHLAFTFPCPKHFSWLIQHLTFPHRHSTFSRVSEDVAESSPGTTCTFLLERSAGWVLEILGEDGKFGLWNAYSNKGKLHITSTTWPSKIKTSLFVAGQSNLLLLYIKGTSSNEWQKKKTLEKFNFLNFLETEISVWPVRQENELWQSRSLLMNKSQDCSDHSVWRSPKYPISQRMGYGELNFNWRLIWCTVTETRTSTPSSGVRNRWGK